MTHWMCPQEQCLEIISSDPPVIEFLDPSPWKPFTRGGASSGLDWKCLQGGTAATNCWLRLPGLKLSQVLRFGTAQWQLFISCKCRRCQWPVGSWDIHHSLTFFLFRNRAKMESACSINHGCLGQFCELQMQTCPNCRVKAAKPFEAQGGGASLLPNAAGGICTASFCLELPYLDSI